MDKSQPLTDVDVVPSFRPVDDAHFSPLDNLAILQPVTKQIVLNFAFCIYNGQPR
jgi:hypothetical protein